MRQLAKFRDISVSTGSIHAGSERGLIQEDYHIMLYVVLPTPWFEEIGKLTDAADELRRDAASIARELASELQLLSTDTKSYGTTNVGVRAARDGKQQILVLTSAFARCKRPWREVERVPPVELAVRLANKHGYLKNFKE